MPGNHDPGRRALPQPAIPQKYNSGLWERENIEMVGKHLGVFSYQLTVFHSTLSALFG